MYFLSTLHADNSTILAFRMLVYIVVVLYISVSVSLSCIEARTLHSVNKTKTKPMVVYKAKSDVNATKNDKICKDKVKAKKFNIKKMDGYISCDYFAYGNSCEELTKLLSKRNKAHKLKDTNK